MLQQAMMGAIASSGAVASNGLLDTLQAYWKLDSNANDAHKNHDGTNTNGTWNTTSYKLGTASWEGNSTNSYINMGNVLDQDGSKPFSIQFYMNLDTVSDYHFFVSKQLTSGNFTGYSVWFNYQSGVYDRLTFSLVNSGSNQIEVATNNGIFSTGTTYHIVITYDGSKSASGVKIYVDASPVAVNTIADTLTGSTSNAANFNIGSRNNGNLPMDGWMDEVAFRQEELSSTKVTTLNNGGAGFGYDSFDSSLGYTIPYDNIVFELPLNGNANDTSGGGADGTASNVTYTAVGSIDVADFNGSTSGISVNYSTTHDPCYVSFWFKSDINTGGFGFNSVIFGQDYGSQVLPLQVRCKQNGENLLTVTTYDNLAPAPKTKEITTSFSDTSGRHHYLAYKNGASFEFWLDNSSQGTGTLHDESNTETYYIGEYPGAAGFFDGKVALVRLYSDAPTADDRQNLYDEGVALLGL